MFAKYPEKVEIFYKRPWRLIDHLRYIHYDKTDIREINKRGKGTFTLIEKFSRIFSEKIFETFIFTKTQPLIHLFDITATIMNKQLNLNLPL